MMSIGEQVPAGRSWVAALRTKVVWPARHKAVAAFDRASTSDYLKRDIGLLDGRASAPRDLLRD